MIRFGAAPAGGGPVAGIASCLGRDVLGVLSARRRSIVTRGACAGHDSGMTEPRAAEGAGVVAGIAAFLRRQMPRRHDQIGAGQARTAGMTIRTVLRRTFEDAVDVARIAALRGVYSRERKTRLDMVKVAGAGLRECLRPTH